jgi:hypothetical protein
MMQGVFTSANYFFKLELFAHFLKIYLNKRKEYED